MHQRGESICERILPDLRSLQTRSNEYTFYFRFAAEFLLPASLLTDEFILRQKREMMDKSKGYYHSQNRFAMYIYAFKYL